jgi:hypothetical protein
MPDLVLRSALVLELCTYLRAELAKRSESYAQGVTVCRTVPNPRPDRVVQFANRGGYALNASFTRSTVDVNVWASLGDELEADNLAALVVGLLELANSAVIADVQVATYPQDVAPDDGQPRRFARLTVTHRAYPVD